MRDYIQVFTTTDSREAAEKIAASVIEKKLAACVQISTCRSMYRWQGKIEQAEEFTCAMKSRADLYPDLERTVRAHHPYEVPEILATQVTSGSVDYLAWMEQELLSREDR